MKQVVILLIIMTLSGCKSTMENQASLKANSNAALDAWHKAAADADYNTYFNLMTDDAVFIGTDATENWNKAAFQTYAKPHFDKGKAWRFTTLERHLHFDATGKIAWFDELLNTQMKICRGSGVLVKIGNQWKIQHYVLSMTIPNENSNEVIKVKSALEDAMIKTLKSKQ
ncbi:MAG: nuclear transport factor 2 family protein [Methylotenera sp.]|nr:nuclear transport factor 2 family protein [Flavobacterium sp.]